MADGNMRLFLANALTLADELLAAELTQYSKDNAGERLVEGELLKRELEVVLAHARDFAGLNPDGSFDKVPKPRPPVKPKGAAK